MFSDLVRQNQAVVGEHSGRCVHVRAPNIWFSTRAGSWRTSTPDPAGGKKLTGTLVAGGLLDYNVSPDFDVAIFGGTGHFKGVVGEIHGKYVAPTTEYELDFEIVP